MFKNVLPLSLVISVRFLGLFIVMPTLSLYALNLNLSTPFLAGLAISVYAISQMLLQTPFGVMSDRIGRKKTIAIGIVIFIIGSLISGFATDIYTLILGRVLQGAGAIGAVVTAMISDIIHEEKRTKAMAIMGGSISLSFMFGMIFGPVIAGGSSTAYLFFISAGLALASLVILFTMVPEVPKIVYGYADDAVSLRSSFQNKDLRIMYFTGFFQKMLLTMAFVIIPIIAIKHFSFQKDDLYIIYLPATLLGVLAMGVGAMFAEKKGKFKEILSAGIILLMLSFLSFISKGNEAIFLIGVFLFFAGFSMHEPIMQSLASKYPKASQRGAILGIFNSFSYFGTFTGGALGGLVLAFKLPASAFIIIALLCVFWIYLIYKLELPKKKAMLFLQSAKIKRDIHTINGVLEHYENVHEKITTIIYDPLLISEEDLEKALIAAEN